MQLIAQQPTTLAQAPMSQADQERKHRMQAAWKAYKGEMQKPLLVKDDKLDDNVLSNRCEPIVNKGGSFLFGSVLKIKCDDQDFSDGLWGDDDDKMTLLNKVAVNGGVFGQAFLKLIPTQEGSTQQYPRLVNLDPRLIRIITHPEDCDLHVAYVIEYQQYADWQKRQIIARVDPNGDLVELGNDDPDDTWTITNYLRRGQQGSWMQASEPEAWLYPFPPIFTCQNLPNPNEAWGSPDLTPDLIDENRVLNFIQSNISRIIKYHGHPLTYVTGMHADQIKIGVDDVLILSAPDAKVDKVGAMDNFNGLLAFVEEIRSNMDEQSRVPAVALGRLAELPRGQISGVALQLLFQPLLEKTQQKRRTYGKLIREVTRAALVVAGKVAVEDYEDYGITLNWQNLLPIDDLAAAQTATLLKALGVSDQTILAELGYDADDEAEKSADEDAKKMTLYSRGQGFPPSTTLPNQQPGQPTQIIQQDQQQQKQVGEA